MGGHIDQGCPDEAVSPAARIGATAECTAPNGVDAAGGTRSYEPTKAFDGKKETARRCSGDAPGRTIVTRFAGPVQLTLVGLVPG